MQLPRTENDFGDFTFNGLNLWVPQHPAIGEAVDMQGYMSLRKGDFYDTRYHGLGFTNTGKAYWIEWHVTVEMGLSESDDEMSWDRIVSVRPDPSLDKKFDESPEE